MSAIMKGESCGYNQLIYHLISIYPLTLIRELDKSHPSGVVLFCDCDTDFLYSKQINTIYALQFPVRKRGMHGGGGEIWLYVVILAFTYTYVLFFS